MIINFNGFASEILMDILDNKGVSIVLLNSLSAKELNTLIKLRDDGFLIYYNCSILVTKKGLLEIKKQFNFPEDRIELFPEVNVFGEPVCTVSMPVKYL